MQSARGFTVTIFGYLAISHYFNKTASPSPVMFWTVKAPFWYALVAPRPMEEPALFAPGSHPAGVPGRLGGTPPLETSAARTRNARDQRCALASPLPPPPFARAPSVCWAALSPPPSSPLSTFVCVCVGIGESRPGGLTPLGRALKRPPPLLLSVPVLALLFTGWLSPLVSGFGFRVSGYHFLTWR